MKLILLPGMDGTGELFQALMRELQADIDTQIISLPAKGSQDYQSLTDYVAVQLPLDSDYCILAESFSGRLAANIAAQSPPNFRGLLLAASFLSQPRPALLRLASSSFIVQLMTSRFMIDIAARLFIPQTQMFSRNRFKQVLSKVDPQTLKNRILAIRSMPAFTASIQIPTLYIQASNDILVAKEKGIELQKIITDYKICRVTGSHFILQSQPKQCAVLVTDFIEALESPK